MTKWVLLASIFLLLFAPRIALAELDPAHGYCGTLACHVKTAKMKNMLGKKIVYELNMSCGYWGSKSPPCPPTQQLIAMGEWDSETGKAYERLSSVGSAEVIAESNWNCPDDPWIKANVKCQFKGGDDGRTRYDKGQWPRSAGPLTAAQRQSLSKEVLAAKMHSQKMLGPAVAASGALNAVPRVEILSPKDGTSVAVRTTLALQVSHAPDRAPACDTFWTYTKPGEFPFQKKMQTVTMAYDKNTGISSGHFAVNKIGDWMVKCHVKSPSGNKPELALPGIRIKAYDSSNQAPPDQNKLPSRQPARPVQK